MYPIELTAPMSKELNNHGIQSVNSAEGVDEILDSKEGTALVVVNSVCGCAGGSARPGVILSLINDIKPDNLITVFAGVDKEATAKAREYMLPYPPSSPAIALFKEGKLVHMLERHHIERATPDMVAANLRQAYDHYCGS
jgi:putative YphP/YqiW family bacilliredoxin